MAFTELEKKRVETIVGEYVERIRPAPEIRPQLDIEFRVTGQSVEIFETSPRWDSKTERAERSVAKATFVKGRSAWKVFWMRADMEWHSYDPAPLVPSVNAFLEVVEQDAHQCFWG